MTPHIYLIAGPSGSGKTTLAQALVQAFPALSKVVTVTTRAPRPGEINGVDYHFVSVDRFVEMRGHGLFVEIDCAYGEWYGTLFSSFIPRSTETPIGFVEVITVEGARRLRSRLDGLYSMTSIFVLPRNAETAAQRIRARNASNSVMRIAGYQQEIDLAYRDGFFDLVLRNTCFEDALADLSSVVDSTMRPRNIKGMPAQQEVLCLR